MRPPREPAIKNSDFHRLRWIEEQFERQTALCADAGAMQAACLFAVATFEARMLVTAALMQEPLRESGFEGWPSGKKKADLLAWGLDDCLEVARGAGWLDDPSLAPEALSDALEECQRLRNAAAHPGRYVRDGGPGEEAHLVGILDVIDRTLGLIAVRIDAVSDPLIGLS